MQIDIRTCAFGAVRGALIVLLSLTLLGSRSSLADVVAVGDTNPVPASINDFGGVIGGDLIIGDTGVGGLFMDIAPPLSQPLETLESPNGTIGNGPEAIGAAVFDDFGVAWEIATKLSVGNEGQGFLDVFDSASIEADVNTVIGEMETGQGVVTLNGAASRLVTDELTVGSLGVGTIDVTSRGALISGNLTGDTIVGEFDGAIGKVSLTDLGSRWTVGGQLVIGNNSSAFGTVEIANEALVQVTDTTDINRVGRVELSSGGILRSITGSSVVNGGLISGDGFVDSTVTISTIGVVSNRALNADTREHLRFSGPVTNGGTIDSFRGEMTFESVLVNNFELIARDAIMNFNGGITNAAAGEIVLGGDTTLHGGLFSPGDIHVLADSEATIVGDLTFTGSSIVSLAVGEAAGTLDVIGTLDLGGATLDLDYSSGVFSQPGDTYQILGATDPITTMFGNAGQQVTDDDGRIWDIIYNTTSVLVTATGLLSPASSADFDQDGDVDGADFLDWQRGFGMPAPTATKSDGDANGDLAVDGADEVIWESEFGNGVGPITALSAVPEPTAAMLMLVALTLAALRRGGC